MKDCLAKIQMSRQGKGKVCSVMINNGGSSMKRDIKFHEDISDYLAILTFYILTMFE